MYTALNVFVQTCRMFAEINVLYSNVLLGDVSLQGTSC